MFILRDLLPPLQAHFSKTDLGKERSAPLRLSPAFGHRSVHLLHDLQFVALSRNVVWHRDETETLLHFHVLDGFAMATVMADRLAFNSIA